MAHAEYGTNLVNLTLSICEYTSTVPGLADGVDAKLADYLSQTNVFLEEVQKLKMQSLVRPSFVTLRSALKDRPVCLDWTDDSPPSPSMYPPASSQGQR